jgi:FdhD protein
VLAREVSVDGSSKRLPRELVVEEPLEIRLGDETVATTMRTPGNDFELAVGWCWAEGYISMAPAEIRYCATGSAVDTGFNVVSVQPDRDDPLAGVEPRPRLSTTTSSCGICGADQIAALTDRLDPVEPTLVPAGSLVGMERLVGDSQELFSATGGSHAAAAVTLDGTVVAFGEDIGRHNAVDKVVGQLALKAGQLAAKAGQPAPRNCDEKLILWVSGRASLEIVQKAWAAEMAAVVAVGAASALAVDTAERANLVLVGFARGSGFTIYCGEDRVTA